MTSHKTLNMKKLVLILLLGGLFVTTGCEKDPVTTPFPTSVQPPSLPGNHVYSGFRVYAGEDIWIPLPANFTVLYGYTDISDPQVESISWKYLSGPDSFLIDNPALRHTRLSNLKKGTYVFEFTVKLKNGYFGSDNVSVHVYEPRVAGANEYIFKGLIWNEFWWYYLSIQNFDLYVPHGAAIKVYLKNTGSTNWIEVFDRLNATYYYEILDNTLYINSTELQNEAIPIEVKVIF